jgi:hypothetical protein
VPADYTVFLAADAAQFLHALKRNEREPVRRFLDSLELYPTTTGEGRERDALGRTVQVKLAGRIKIAYWCDHAVKEVKVLRIERVRPP